LGIETVFKHASHTSFVKDTQANLIIDLGSGYMKCGFSQQTEPIVIPAAFKNPKPGSARSVFIELDPGRSAWLFPLEDGLLPRDTSQLIQLCNQALEQFPTMNKQRKKLQLTLLLFPQILPDQVTAVCKELQETLGCLHIEAAIQQILTWGYWGRKTGLIVDIGYTSTFVTPIYRGFLMEEEILPLVTGSFFVSAEIRKLLLHKVETAPTDLLPFYKRLATNANSIRSIKQSHCQVFPMAVDDVFEDNIDLKFEGVDIPLGPLPWQAPEILFQPTLLGVGDKGLTEAIVEVLQGVDSTVRAELAANIVLTGGGSMIPGLATRIETDLKRQIPHLSVKVYDLEYPLYSSWLGAAKM
jgi:actin-related protein